MAVPPDIDPAALIRSTLAGLIGLAVSHRGLVLPGTGAHAPLQNRPEAEEPDGAILLVSAERSG